MPRHPHLFISRATYRGYLCAGYGEFGFDEQHEAIEFMETLREVHDLDG
jgi:hypothetical protein